MRNLLCLLPDGHIVVGYYGKHPCDGKAYLLEALCWGPRGPVGRWMPHAASNEERA